MSDIPFLTGNAEGQRILVLAGSGGNGGGGIACARTLYGWGARPHVLLNANRTEFCGVPGRQLKRLQYLGIPLKSWSIESSAAKSAAKSAAAFPARQAVDSHRDPPQNLHSASLPDTELIVDALIGYGLSGTPRGSTAALIRAANAHPAPVLSLDVPSGLDATSGEAFDPTIQAAATLTLALPKTGLAVPGANRWTGDLYLADIGIPAEVYRAPGLELEVGPVFARDEILRL